MATFLSVSRLRAHEVPALPRALFDWPDRGRPVLAARWHVAADGRLVCGWHEVIDPVVLPPD